MPARAVLAITRLPSFPAAIVRTTPEPHDIAVVAATLQCLPYEITQRMSGAAPWILASIEHPSLANTFAAQLQRNGFGTQIVDPDALNVFSPSPRTSVTLTDDTLTIASENVYLAMRDVSVILHAVHSSEDTLTKTETEVVGYHRGVPITAEKVKSSYDKQGSLAVYLATELGAPILRLTQDGVRLSSLQGHTTRHRFDGLLQWLSAQCTRARVDTSLLQSPRKRLSTRDFGTLQGTHRVESSNHGACDLAAKILIESHFATLPF